MSHAIPGRNIEIHKNEFDLFTPAAVQNSVEDGYWRSYPPSATVNPDSGPIMFELKEDTDYLDLFNSYLKVVVKVVDSRPNKGVMAAQCEVGLTNNALHSLFKSIQVQLGNTVINQSHNDYAYRAYIENLLSYGSEAKKSFLQAEGFFEDTPGHFDTRGDQNRGYKHRKAMVKESKQVELIGKLHLDLLHQPLYLLNNTLVRIQLDRNKDGFALMGNNANAAAADDHAKATFLLKIESAKLFVRHVVPTQSVALEHEKMLSTMTAKYPVRRVVVTSFTINQGSRNEMKTGLFSGQLPHRVTVGIVDNRGYNGDLEHNPFNFQHYDLSSIQLHVGSRPVPMEAIDLDYENDAYMEGYFTLFNQTGQYGSDEGNAITRADYKNGNALYCFNLSTDMNIEDDHFNPTKTGKVNVDVKFRVPLPETVSVILLGEFDNTIEIDRARNVTTDYMAN